MSDNRTYPTPVAERDRWRYEDSRLFCNEQYVAIIEPKDGDESTCEYVAKTLDDYGRAIGDYEHEMAKLRRERDELLRSMARLLGAANAVAREERPNHEHYDSDEPCAMCNLFALLGHEEANDG